MTTLLDAANSFLANIHKSKSELTYRAYYNVLLGNANGFLPCISSKIKMDAPIEKLTEKHAMQYMTEIIGLSPATRQLHAACIRRFYAYVAGQDWATVSLDRLNFLFEGANVLTPVHRQIIYDHEKVEQFLDWVNKWNPNGNTKVRHLRNMRDKAFVLTLAQSGLRVHEACKLRIKDVNFENASGVVIGKGNKQARFKIGDKALAAVRAYLDNRQTVHALKPDQPVFARHDRKASKDKVESMSPQTGEAIIHDTELLALGTRELTCHTLRHRFVTHQLEVSHNLKAAQILARHSNIIMTERYAHLIDSDVDEDFDKAFNE